MCSRCTRMPDLIVEKLNDRAPSHILNGWLVLCCVCERCLSIEVTRELATVHTEFEILHNELKLLTLNVYTVISSATSNFDSPPRLHGVFYPLTLQHLQECLVRHIE